MALHILGWELLDRALPLRTAFPAHADGARKQLIGCHSGTGGVVHSEELFAWLIVTGGSACARPADWSADLWGFM